MEYLPHWPQIKGSRDIKLGLDRVLRLLDRLGNPHKKLPPTIHIAGTNGKGSTLAYIDAALTDAGYKVHKYTSPHLVSFNERIVLAGKQIDDKYLLETILECERAAEIRPKIDVTFFEGVTVAAFLAFSKIKADILLLETGMGGRLDATNVIDNPILTILTSISKDHTEFLGDTISKIAHEKAGIIKKNAPVIVASRDRDVTDVVDKKVAILDNITPLFLGKHFDYKIDKNKMKLDVDGKVLDFPLPSLPGDHQVENAALAIAALYVQNTLKVSLNSIKKGLKNVKWNARIQKINKGKFYKKLPKNYELYVDGGHNPQASKMLSSWIYRDNMKSVKEGKKKPDTYLICSMLRDKDSSGFFQYLSGLVDFAVAVPIENDSRVQKNALIAKQASKSGIKATYSGDFDQAFKYIKTIHENKSKKVKNLVNKVLFKKQPTNKARIIVCGSLHLAGEFLKENG